MKKEIIVNNVKFDVIGEWTIEGFTNCFKGTAFSTSDDTIPVNCSIPISLIQVNGIEYFEEHILKSLEDFLKSKSRNTAF